MATAFAQQEPDARPHWLKIDQLCGQIQFAAPGAAYKTVKTATPGKRGCYFDTSVRFTSSGNVRLAWNGQYSRTQAIRIH